ncbi:MAG: hypothetical protein ACKVXR_17415 [Planctomycetota bacterium]
MAEALESRVSADAASLPVWIRALRAALGRPPVWLVVWGLEAALAIAPALLLHAWLEDAIRHRYEPGSLFRDLGEPFRFDHRLQSAMLDATTGRLGSVLVVLAVLLGIFSAGGWLQVFLEPTRGHSLQRFFLGGARYFWRFFRLAIVTLLLLSLLTWLVQGWAWNTIALEWILGVPAGDAGRLETLPSERTVFLVRGAQELIYALGFALLLVWGDYGRARLALHDTSSAVWAGLCTAASMIRHPVKMLRPMIGLLLVEGALVVAAGVLARSIEGEVGRDAGLGGVAALLGIGQLVLLWRIVLRGSRYHAAIQVSREVVLPIARPDPWKGSLGPPGGPRYPLGGDEFGMSL